MSEPNIEGNAGNASTAPAEPRHMRRAIIIWIVLSVVLIAIWLAVSQFILPQDASSLGAGDNFTFNVFTVLSIPVAMFVFVFLAYSLLVFRTRGRPTEDGIPLQPRLSLQVGWLGITSLLCLFLVIWGLFAFYQETSAAATPNTLVVQVTAQQWQWTFNYPQYNAASNGAQVIELPVNRPVIFYVTSDDVLHGFAIQALGVRVDANPGEVTTTAVVTPTQIGSYTVRCVELCGLLHSYMWESVKVVSTDSFNSWIQSQGGHL
ncbi:MAG TPA: cytochrome c oxidase subunit II [Ktedonobacteraceae bacterium]|nr:cytochrome c oxidase subunit II [Ktedonobacteraceae bacterium]